MKTVRPDSGGAVKRGNGTLYGSLKRMLGDGLVEHAGGRSAADDDTVHAGGRVDTGFWGALLADTFSGAAGQHADDGRAAPGATVLALLLFPAV